MIFSFVLIHLPLTWAFFFRSTHHVSVIRFIAFSFSSSLFLFPLVLEDLGILSSSASPTPLSGKSLQAGQANTPLICKIFTVPPFPWVEVDFAPVEEPSSQGPLSVDSDHFFVNRRNDRSFSYCSEEILFPALPLALPPP